jgi:hypothetical protein
MTGCLVRRSVRRRKFSRRHAELHLSFLVPAE